MRLLIDTNILLEVILQQDRAQEAQALLKLTEQHTFFMTDFSLHSVGLLLFRRGQHDIFRSLIEDMLLNAGMAVIALSPEDMSSVIQAAQRFNLDFDDAYQYAAAGKHGLTLVSFDIDFDRTQRGRQTPASILAG